MKKTILKPESSEFAGMRLAYFHEWFVRLYGKPHERMPDSYIEECIESTCINCGPVWIFNMVSEFGVPEAPKQLQKLINKVLSKGENVSEAYSDWDYCSDGDPGGLPSWLILTEKGAKVFRTMVKLKFPKYYSKLISATRMAIEVSVEERDNGPRRNL